MLQRESQLLDHITTQLYQWQRTTRQHHQPKFILHDGPPFANGRLHIGHFLNKTLKDMINRYKLLQHYYVEYVPGWDCHGLPIEQKVLEQLRSQSNTIGEVSDQLSPTEVRLLCRQFAAAAIEDQCKDFKRWAVIGEWDKPYLTMDPQYEVKQLDVFSTMHERGLIYRGLKPVYWSPASKTALAEAELEYVDNHLSPAVYVKFPIAQYSQQLRAAGVTAERFPQLSALIWTTTPWTLPSNIAIAYHNDLQYAVVKLGRSLTEQQASPAPSQQSLSDDQIAFKHIAQRLQHTASQPNEQSEFLLIGVDRIEDIQKLLNRQLTIEHTFSGSALEGVIASHPFISNQLSTFIHGNHVTTDAGTALVHSAPAHGADDWQVCKQHNLKEPPLLIDEHGHFNQNAPTELREKHIHTSGNKTVIDLLLQHSKLVHLEKYLHRYPYDWRSKTPVIVRATEQWFCKLDVLSQQALLALQNVQTVPANARNRFSAMLSTRSEWCISRQRHWGLPIPAFYHRQTGEVLMNSQTIQHLQNLVQQHGSNCWWSMSEAELLPADIDASQYVKGKDTLDVWFDSGSSWRSIQSDNNPNQMTSADVYLEGGDQYRGWFQSSLLTAVATHGQAPYKTLITHGMVLDDKQRKMSKSLGNVVDPAVVIGGEIAAQVIQPAQLAAATKTVLQETAAANQPVNSKHQQKQKQKQAKAQSGTSKQLTHKALGVDVLRLWVASCDYSIDMSIGSTSLQKVQDNFKRIRIIGKFLLGNLHDFIPSKHALPYDQLSSLDQYMLDRLHHWQQQITANYDQYDFRAVYSTLMDIIATDLSALYFEACKDRLYVDGVDSVSRRGAQTVLLHVLDWILKTIAPIIPFTAQEIYSSMSQPLKQACGADLNNNYDGVFALPWWSQGQSHSPSTVYAQPTPNSHIVQHIDIIRQIRSRVNKCIEIAKTERHISIGSNVDAEVILYVQPDGLIANTLQAVGDTETNIILLTSYTIIKSYDKLADDEQIAKDSASLTGTVTTAGVDGSSTGSEQLGVRVSFAGGVKCPRCWKYSVDDNDHNLCNRCSGVVHSSIVA